MGHTHSAEDHGSYYIEQLCTIGFCGALGVVQILYYHYDALFWLSNKFHIWVLLSGIVLTALAVVRGVVLWVMAGRLRAEHVHDHECCHDHDHAHAHSHDHDHEHAHSHHHEHEHSDEHGIVATAHVHTDARDHSHEEHDHVQAPGDCGHDHGWAPWRYVVLLLPIVLFLIGMPWPAQAVPDDPVEAGVMPLDFNDLKKAATTDDQRKFWEGKLVRVKGQFAQGQTDKTFGLFRLKMTCCAADAYPLNVKIVSPEPVPFERLEKQWVNVTGTVKFDMPKGRDEFNTLLIMRSVHDVKQTAPDPRPFLQ
jgi:hypothetical protein